MQRMLTHLLSSSQLKTELILACINRTIAKG